MLILDTDKILKYIVLLWLKREQGGKGQAPSMCEERSGCGLLTTLAIGDQEVEERPGGHAAHEHWPLTWCLYLPVNCGSMKVRFWLIGWTTPHLNHYCEPRGTQVFPVKTHSALIPTLSRILSALCSEVKTGEEREKGHNVCILQNVTIPVDEVTAVI